MGGSRELIGEHAKTAEIMLHKVTELLEKIDVPYILDAGTLLGIIRENRLLPWDNDLDIAIQYNSVHTILKYRWKLWLMGYRTHISRFKRDIGPFKKGEIRIIKIQTRYLLFIKKDNLLDIFVKKKINDEHVMILGHNPPFLEAVPAKYMEQRTLKSFNQKKYFIPEDFDGYLTYNYGDWHTPVKDWDFKTDNKCIKEVYRK